MALGRSLSAIGSVGRRCHNNLNNIQANDGIEVYLFVQRNAADTQCCKKQLQWNRHHIADQLTAKLDDRSGAGRSQRYLSFTSCSFGKV